MKQAAKAGRNDPCPCGSGKKYKKCCELKASHSRSSVIMMLIVGAAIVGAIAAVIASVMSEKTGAGGQVWSPEHGHYHDAGGGEIR